MSRFALPHRRKTSEIRDLLKAGYIELIATGQTPLAKPPSPVSTWRPRRPTCSARSRPSPRPPRTRSSARRAPAAKCHAMEPAAERSQGDGGAAFNIKPVPDRTVWFTHAKFNHASHRGATCAACHPNTGAAGNIQADADAEPVQILGVDSCRTCHSPTNARITLPDGTKTFGGGIRSSCTDCHRYHHGDQPLQGRGAESWFPRPSPATSPTG